MSKHGESPKGAMQVRRKMFFLRPSASQPTVPHEALLAHWPGLKTPSQFHIRPLSGTRTLN